jgi:Zn-dependent peptidase ImmA (M78 family)
MPDEIAAAAEEVLRALGMWRLPVDPFAIAKEERIRLVPGVYGEGFDARIEYYAQFQRFGIFYRDFGKPEGRIRFSLGHELGHFFLPEHRERLLSGKVHDSKSDYRSRNPIELQADRFAANLLMPRDLFVKQVKSFRQSVCDLKDLCRLAARLGTSVTSTAIRYCDCDIEGATAVLSENGIVQWTYASEDMRHLGCYFVESGSAIPRDSETAKLLKLLDGGPTDQVVGHQIDSHVWFDGPKRNLLYEEAMQLGNRVLTWLVIDE